MFIKNWHKCAWGVFLLAMACGTKSPNNAPVSRGLIVTQPVGLAEKPHSLPNLWGVTVGISQYEEKSINLKYSDADAEAIAQILREQEGKVFKKVHIEVLINERATRDNIRNSINYLNRAAPNDTVFIFIAGHGIQREDGSYFFIPHNASLDNYQQQGLSWEDFQKDISNLFN